MAANSNGNSKGSHLAPYQFRRGVSGNPSGRPQNKGLAAVIAELTEDGRTLIAFLVDVATGKLPGRTQDRIRAAEDLMDRLWGKPPQAMELSGPGGGPLGGDQFAALDGLSIDELRALAGQRDVLIDQRERMLRLLEAQRQAVASRPQVVDAGPAADENAPAS